MKQPRTFSSGEPSTFENRSSQGTKSVSSANISEDSHERAECVSYLLLWLSHLCQGQQSSFIGGRQAGGHVVLLTSPDPCPVLSQTRLHPCGGAGSRVWGLLACLHMVSTWSGEEQRSHENRWSQEVLQTGGRNKTVF